MGMRGTVEDTALAAKPWKKKINPNITCYGCGKKGHISRQCRSGKGKSAGDQKGSTTANAAVEDDFAFCGDDLALMASPDSWLSDSACTSHIARNKSHFITYTATPGHKISGFGNVPGLGRGTIRLESTVNGKSHTITLKDVVHAPDAVLYPPPQFPSGTERFRAVPSVSECFRVFPTIFQLSSERFQAVLSNSERFRAFPIYFIKNFKVHF